MRLAAAILLALAILGPVQVRGLPVTAQEAPGGAVVAWDGPPGGCVYLVDPDGGRWRLGCVTRGGQWRDVAGTLWPGDVVEVRSPGPAGRVTGRAMVEEAQDD